MRNESLFCVMTDSIFIANLEFSREGSNWQQPTNNNAIQGLEPQPIYHCDSNSKHRPEMSGGGLVTLDATEVWVSTLNKMVVWYLTKRIV